VGPFPFPKSDPKKRVNDFSEVQQPYTEEQARQEASRCLLCGTPVCMDACPVQMDVRGMCDAVARGDFALAHARIRETNALLGVTARCCPQLQGLCEDACVMRWDGQPISIGMIQRFVSDWEANGHAQPAPFKEASTGKSVAVIGSGPCGLAAADLLSRYGHSVTIYEELESPGGTAWYGIPDYHLPKQSVLLTEVDKIKQGVGVKIVCGTKVGEDITLSQILDEHDAAMIATGSRDVVKLDTPGIDLRGVYDGYQFLMDVFSNGVDHYLEHPTYELGKEILVVGGGDSALDAARTALRLSKGNVTLVYRRSENEMPADSIMTDEAKEEGVQFRFLTDPKHYNGSNGTLESVTMNKMKLGEPDESGRRKPVPVEGGEFEIKCSAVLLSVGRGPDSCLQSKVKAIKTGKKNSISIDDRFQTTMKRVFAAGDVTTGETLVVKAMGAGREAAQRVHEYLQGIDESSHVSLYERYFVQRSVEKMMREDASGKRREEELPP